MPTPPVSLDPSPSTETLQQLAQQVLQHHQGQPGSLLPILHAVQHALGHIPADIVPMIATGLQLSRAEIHGVISFYPHFRQQPAAPVVLEICRAEACQAMGGVALADYARQKLGCDFNGTTPDGAIMLAPVYCLGLCAQSPAAMINGQPHARLTPTKLDQLLQAQEAQP